MIVLKEGHISAHSESQRSREAIPYVAETAKSAIFGLSDEKKSNALSQKQKDY
jgi:hypothetical protein